jgi:hypothetical protein
MARFARRLTQLTASAGRLRTAVWIRDSYRAGGLVPGCGLCAVRLMVTITAQV